MSLASETDYNNRVWNRTPEFVEHLKGRTSITMIENLIIRPETPPDYTKAWIVDGDVRHEILGMVGVGMMVVYLSISKKYE